VRRISRDVIIAGVALLAVLLTCSPLWQLRARADRTVISAWRPTAQPAGVAVAAAAQRATPRAKAQPIVAAMLATPQPTPAPSPAPDPWVSQAGAQIDGYLNDLVNGHLFQGAVLVARDGRVILSKGYGDADAAGGIPNSVQTRFRLASVTKQFTAAAILLLQARGQLNIGESICAYLDACPDAWRAITIQHLLTHTSGLPNYTDFAGYDATQAQAATPADLVARFRDLPLVFDPGTSYMYENSDYVLLGLIVERVSGQTYADFMRSAIFEPLGMHDSGLATGTAAAAGEAIGYRVFGEPAPALDPTTLFSAGGLYSTVEDMYRWDQALYTTQLLPAPLLAEMWTPHAENYGYGWRIDSAFGRLRIGHPGLIDGFQAVIARYPNDRVTVIVLSNMTGADVDGISYYIASMIFAGSG
jgi:CubicO group peptidase (beta-lactamase class C family)